MIANCKHCKKKFVQKTFNLRYCCETEECREACAKYVLEKKKRAIEKKTKERSKERLRVMKENITNYKKLLQDDVNQIAKLIDFGLKGLHVSSPYDTEIQAGHVYSVKNNEQMRFNLHNIHRQGAKSNMALVYDEEFRDALIDEYGNDYFLFIKGLKKQPLQRIKQHEYKEYHERALSIIKRLKKDLKQRSLTERIELRNEINRELGIYEEQFIIFKF